VAVVDGVMIDEPHVALARRVLAAAEGDPTADPSPT
jgi:citrate lyase beta subunit